jgi:hypothetical protein
MILYILLCICDESSKIAPYFLKTYFKTYAHLSQHRLTELMLEQAAETPT